MKVNKENIFKEKQAQIIEVNDTVIKNLFSSNKINKFLSIIDNSIILNYIDTRFSDSTSRTETIQRIKLGIEEKPKCPTCGKPVIWIGKPSKLYTTYCSNKCSASNKNTRQKATETCRKKYGVDNVSQSKEIRQKVIETNRQRYGADYGLQTDYVRQKSIKTCQEKYGVNIVSQNNEIKQKISLTHKSSETKQKYKDTCQEKYGVDHIWQSKSVKEKIVKTTQEKYGVNHVSQSDLIKQKHIKTCQDRYGVNCVFQVEDFKQKKWQTYKKHMSFNTSKQEELLYEYLKQLYPDVIHHYKTIEYPFECDFFIPCKQLYIEYQGSMFHNFRPFLNTEEDKLELLKLKEKADARYKIINKKTMYHATIETWAERDVKKREIAKNNKLNYLEIFKFKDINDVINQINLYINNSK